MGASGINYSRMNVYTFSIYSSILSKNVRDWQWL